MTAPTPPPPLAYPPPHWMVLTYLAVDSVEQRVVTITSDVALHLALEFSPQEPEQSNRRSWRRGMGWVRDKHWSFFPVGIVEQAETGDTTTHTFYIPSYFCTGRLYFRFAHGYAANYVCPVCSAASLPMSYQFEEQQDRIFMRSVFYCSACVVQWRLNEIVDASISKSTSPFFSALPAASDYALAFNDTFQFLIRLEEVFFDAFSS